MALGRVYLLADKALDGKLEDRLRAERASGSSFREIARGLFTDGITVSDETVRTWCHELGIEQARAS